MMILCYWLIFILLAQLAIALCLCWRVHRLQLRNIKLRAECCDLRIKLRDLQKPNWYFDNDNNECSCDTIKGTVDEYDIGEVVKLQPCHYLPLIYVVCDDTGHEVFDNEDDANEAAEKWGI